MSEDGRLTGPGTLEFRRSFAADIDTVWQFLTDPEKRKTWFCGGETGTARGEEIVFDFDHRRLSNSPAPEKYRDQETARFTGEILEYDPPHRLSFTWPDANGEGSKVEIVLSEAAGGGTDLHLVHSQLGTAEYRIGALAGWHAHFDLLEDIVAGREVRDFWTAHTALEDRYREIAC